MPYNGSGTYALPAGNPVSTGSTISTTTHNNTNTDIASALSNCITRDGQSAPTANIPMGGFKHTGLAAGTGNGESVRYDEFNGHLIDAVAAHAASAIANTPAGNIVATDIQAAINELDTEKAALAGSTFTGGINEARGTVAMHATTMDLWAQPNTIDGTGAAVVITAIVNAPQAGAKRTLYPITGTTITQGATFSVQGAVSYVTLAGDALVFEAVTVSTYKVAIVKANGSPITPTPPPAPLTSMVRLHTANGYGSTNTKIRRFTTVVTNQGTDITYADSATLGASFTINTSGMYGVSFTDSYSAAATLGLSVNTTQPTVSIVSIPAAEQLASSATAAANFMGCCGSTIYLLSGDVVRAHTSGTTTGAIPADSNFTISRVD